MAKRKDDRKSEDASYHQRKHINKRDAGQCQYCGLEVTMAECNIDHVVPRSERGPTNYMNLVLACSSCNELKGGQLIPEELRPRRGDQIPTRKEKRAGKKTEAQQKASDRMKDTISIIREASAMGMELDDLFTEGTQDQWK